MTIEERDYILTLKRVASIGFISRHDRHKLKVNVSYNRHTEWLSYHPPLVVVLWLLSSFFLPEYIFTLFDISCNLVLTLTIDKTCSQQSYEKGYLQPRPSLQNNSHFA